MDKKNNFFPFEQQQNRVVDVSNICLSDPGSNLNTDKLFSESFCFLVPVVSSLLDYYYQLDTMFVHIKSGTYHCQHSPLSITMKKRSTLFRGCKINHVRLQAFSESVCIRFEFKMCRALTL
jgi:hypothetical protein